MRPFPFNNPFQQFPAPFPIGPEPGLVAAWLADQARKRQSVEPAPQIPLIDRFRMAELEAAKLRQDLRSSRLTQDQIKTRLAKLMVRDGDGNWWILNYKSGQWMRFAGKQLIPAEPTRNSFMPKSSLSRSTSVPSFEANDQSGWGRWIAWFVVFLILLGVALAIAST